MLRKTKTSAMMYVNQRWLDFGFKRVAMKINIWAIVGSIELNMENCLSR